SVSPPAPGRPLPPVRTPLKEPPVGPRGTRVRRMTGTAPERVAPEAVLNDTLAFISPGCTGLVRCTVIGAVCPGWRVSVEGLRVPATIKRELAMLSCTGPL